MPLSMLTTMIDFLDTASLFNETMRIWFPAVCSLCFCGMRRINEVLLMKKGDIQLGLHRKSAKHLQHRPIHYGCFTIRDRKTDHAPHASRTYSLHHLPKDERAAEACTFVGRWFEHASTRPHRKWVREEYAFPSLTKIPRG